MMLKVWVQGYLFVYIMFHMLTEQNTIGGYDMLEEYRVASYIIEGHETQVTAFKNSVTCKQECIHS